jgi:hypothetical protein
MLPQHHTRAGRERAHQERDGQNGGEDCALNRCGKLRARHVEHELLALRGVGLLGGQLHKDSPAGIVSLGLDSGEVFGGST